MATDDILLVTGASGQLGQLVVKQLLDSQGVPAKQIIATSRHPEKLAGARARGVTVRKADFDDAAGLADALAGATRVLIISTDRIDVPGLRLRQHRTAIDAAVNSRAKHVVYTSMMNPEPGSPIPFAPDHYGTEQMLASSALGWTVLRNCWYTDSLLQSLRPAVATGQLYSAAGGERGVCYVTREDCARVCAAALSSVDTSNGTYDITGPAAISAAELANIVSDVTGKSVRLVPVTAEQLQAGLAAAGLPPPIASLISAIDVNTRAGNVARATDSVRRLTGKTPQSVHEFLRAHAAALTS
jgi:NAD(P)H dehydrogenase (quinone)